VSTIIDGHISKLFDEPGCREVVGDGTGLLAGRCVGQGGCSEGRQLIVEGLEQIRLRWLGRLMVAPQLVAIVIFERYGEPIEEVEYVAGALIREFGRVNKHE
jgi:hypothetical protein